MARILISESHRDVRRLLERMLVRLGHEPIRVRVPETEQLLSADVVIVEPSDPIGAVLSQAASIARPSLPLICASVTEPPAELTELGVSFSACLIKPFTTKQLEAAIDQALHARQTPKDNTHARDQQHPGTELASRQNAKRAASPTSPPTASGTPLPSSGPNTSGRRVLLIDDDQDLRETARRTLERSGGWSVISVSSGEEALDIAVEAGPFDAVLLDVTMPGLNGLATMDGLRECGLPEDVPIIFLGTNAGDCERQALIFLGGVGVIVKPIDSQTFPGEVQRLLATTELYSNDLSNQ
jgi:CheY-like chemotaxis protein